MLLEAETPGPLPADVLQAIGSGHTDGTFDGLVSGYRVERRAGMIVERGADVSIGPRPIQLESGGGDGDPAPVGAIQRRRELSPSGRRPAAADRLVARPDPRRVADLPHGKRFRARFGPEKKVFYRQVVEAGLGPLQLR